jgi:TPR repeat protein
MRAALDNETRTSMTNLWHHQRPPHDTTIMGPVIAAVALVGTICLTLLLHHASWSREPMGPAQELSMAEALFRDEHYQSAAGLFAALANKENPTAEYWLGHMTELGLGRPRDPVKAVELYKRAAAGDVAAAMLRLGEIYLVGNLVPPDYAQAKSYLERAAHNSDAKAAMLLGEMYRRGLGTSRDLKQAYAWSEVSAIEGNPAARKDRNQELSSLSSEDRRAAARQAAQILGSIRGEMQSAAEGSSEHK